MGSGQSVGMAGFSLMTEEDYDALSFPSTPPPYRAAMELAAKFGEIDLGVSASSPSSAPICEGCGRSLGARKRILSLDETEPVEESKENQQEESKEEESKSSSPHTGAFTYDERTYCSLDCFFFKHASKPCLCAYVDKLAEVLFSLEGN